MKFYIFIIGLISGSFITALVWRTYQQNNESVNKKSFKLQGVNLSITTGRSLCPNCEHQLGTFDLVPLLSWLLLRGKCRYCKKSIPALYPLTELSTAMLFLLCYLFWPYTLTGTGLFGFVSWLIILTGLIALVIFDFKWMLLPDKITYILIVIALMRLVVLVLLTKDPNLILGAVWGILVLFGLFYIIFQISGGKWIGGGDGRGTVNEYADSVYFFIFRHFVLTAINTK
jgi:leader peptidase (prepilin peptidase)/N-methyltransferase